ncbi:MAG: cyclodeaminase/cyclohydrolase family protein [Bacillota bacterium]|nr:cyclodeaminase/cyclohydrolase family protein [Bacillota bacterium]MDW7730517.1 cyclodeaminase/cyclohydrolase family protein [Bacillota bacterium]
MLKDLPVEVFVREVSAASPVPSSGSVAALAGAQAAALLSMYCNVSQDRDKLGDFVEVLQKAGEEARFLMSRQLETIDDDTIAFNQVMEAFRLPKDNDASKTKRSSAIREAVEKAAEITLMSARGVLRTLSIINEVATKGNPSAVTDLGLANLQAFSGLTGSYYNVRANLGLLKLQGRAGEIKGEADEILKQGQALFDSNRHLIENEM